MKKKVYMLAGLFLTASISANSFAADSTGGTQNVNTTVPGPSWELVIPANQEIPYRQESTDIVHGDCQINNVKHIPTSKMISAYLTHTGKFVMNNDTSTELQFTLRDYNGKDVAADAKLVVSEYILKPDDLMEEGQSPFTNICAYDVNVVISKATWDDAAPGEYQTRVQYTSVLESKHESRLP